jgi:hypothetical protein
MQDVCTDVLEKNSGLTKWVIIQENFYKIDKILFLKLCLGDIIADFRICARFRPNVTTKDLLLNS